VEIVSKRCEGDIHRTTWAGQERRARRLAKALEGLGVAQGERVARSPGTATATSRSYYGASGSGRVCHTINPRLFPEQIAWIANRRRGQRGCASTSASCPWSRSSRRSSAAYATSC
jgi:fatty-acyl-CoA synthase